MLFRKSTGTGTYNTGRRQDDGFPGGRRGEALLRGSGGTTRGAVLVQVGLVEDEGVQDGFASARFESVEDG